jgi:excinuclease ABC subunit C
MIPIEQIPEQAGCYLFYHRNTIIYIGKAKNLRKRIKSYFQHQDLSAKTELMAGLIDHLDYIVTDNELEALILENTLIKKHQPRYNINLKDAKSYAFLKITAEAFPRLITCRQKDDKGYYFGPFTSGMQRNLIQKTLQKIYRLRTCAKLPKKPCLRYHLQLCSAPCIFPQISTTYQQGIEQIKLILNGHISTLIQSMHQEMQEAAKSLEFEQALILRNRIQALTFLSEKQKMDRHKKNHEDIINYSVQQEQVFLMTFQVTRGLLENKQEYVFPHYENFLEEFLLQYYSGVTPPAGIILPQAISPVLIEFLCWQRKKKVQIIIPRRGEKKKLLDLVAKNIELHYFGWYEPLNELQQILKLDKLPDRIECFDISHLSGSFMVASMVRFHHGLPDKSNYRRFKIKTLTAIDDPKAIFEVVSRRYSRLFAEQGLSAMPDLVIVDGGRSQLQAALQALEPLNIRLPVMAIAKKEEHIYLPGKMDPLMVSKKNKGLSLIRRIRDEAHRFAITYHKLLRQKGITKAEE